MEIDHSLTGLPTGVTAEDAAAQFDRLQQKLGPLWRSIESFNQDEQTIVVVPSMSLEMAATGLAVQAYEERFLFLLLLLTQPRARMVYVTSQAIHLSVIEYYLGLRRGLHFGQVRQTGVVFHMLSALGSSGRLGLTAVGDSPEKARAIFERAETALEEEAQFLET